MPVFGRQLPSQSCNLKIKPHVTQGSPFFTSRFSHVSTHVSTFAAAFFDWFFGFSHLETPGLPGLPEVHHTQVEDVEPPSPPPEPKSNLRRRRPKPLSWEPQGCQGVRTTRTPENWTQKENGHQMHCVNLYQCICIHMSMMYICLYLMTTGQTCKDAFDNM